MARESGSRLKHPAGWFAAGREVARATTLLSDGAFKLYMYLCLNAGRTTGRLNIDHGGLAKALHKSRRSIITYVEELRLQGVCNTLAAVNQHVLGTIEISDPFWPYEKKRRTIALPSLSDYTDSIRRLLQTRRCVKNHFGPSDEGLAADLFRRAVSLEQVEHGYLLGCARKYVALLNGQAGGPITSLKYFLAVIDEAGQSPVSTDYWKYLHLRVERLERQWIERGASVSSEGKN